MRGDRGGRTLYMDATAMTEICNEFIEVIADMTAVRYTSKEPAGSKGSRVDKTQVDAEVRAMSRVVEAIDGLDAAATQRVLEWTWKRFVGGGVPDAGRERGAAVTEHADLPELYMAARPAGDAEKVLVVGYWHQVNQGKDNLDAQTIHTDLKNLGHGVGNVTRACSALITAKPQLMIQVKKAGSTRQARKQYRLTTAGVQRVREKLATGDRES